MSPFHFGPQSRYLGKVLVDTTPESYNKRWHAHEDSRCSPDLPKVRGGLNYAIRISGFGNTRPTFNLAQNYRLDQDVMRFRDVTVQEEGYFLELPYTDPMKDEKYILYAFDIRNASQPFFIHLFEVGTDGKIPSLPTEFLP